jgi:acetoin utilization deacetylase AcuC-like enzyme
MTKIVREIADATCKGRIVSMLEGGYNLDALADSVEAHRPRADGVESMHHRGHGDHRGVRMEEQKNSFSVDSVTLW